MSPRTVDALLLGLLSPKRQKPMLGTTNLFNEADKFVVRISMMDAHELVEQERAEWKWRRRHGRAWERVGVRMLPPQPPSSDSGETSCTLGQREMVVNAIAVTDDSRGEPLQPYERRVLAKVQAWPQIHKGLETNSPTIVAGGRGATHVTALAADDPIRHQIFAL